MSDEISLSLEDNCIRVKATGAPSLDGLRRTLSQINALSREHARYRVLVDSREVQGQPPGADIYDGGELLAEALAPGTRVAVLVRTITDDHRFFENVAVNRGVPVCYFQDEAMALDWLGGSA